MQTAIFSLKASGLALKFKAAKEYGEKTDLLDS